MPPTPPPVGQNPVLLVAAGLGGLVLLALLGLVYLRHQAPAVRRRAPAAAPPPAASAPYAPVYGGGPPVGKRRSGF